MQGFKALLQKKMEKPEIASVGMMEKRSTNPNVCLDSKQFPDIKDWSLGKEYTFKARYKSKQEKDDGFIHGDFEIIAAEGKATEPEKEAPEKPEPSIEDDAEYDADLD